MSLAVSQRRSSSPPVTAGLVLLVAVFAASAAMLWREAPQNDLGHRIAWIVFFLLQMPMVVLVHEMGHYGVARLLGWRVPIFIWGSLVIRLTPFRVMHSANALGRSLLGAVVAVPPAGRESRAGWIAVYAGGPLATLCCGLIGLKLSVIAGSRFEAGLVFGLFAILCFADAAFNLIPFRSSNDGRQIVGFLAGRDVARSALHTRLFEQEINGVRPRDWPVELVDAMRAESLWRDCPYAAVNVYAYHLDRGAVEAARQAIMQAAETPQVLIERAFFLAWVDQDAAAARSELAKAPRLQTHEGYWLAVAAIAAAEGDEPDAREAIRKARIGVAERAYSTAFDYDQLDALERRLTEAA
jgi:hypothetical protein